MGGKKRSREEDYEKILKKIRRLEGKVKRKSRREYSSNSDSDSEAEPERVRSRSPSHERPIDDDDIGLTLENLNNEKCNSSLEHDHDIPSKDVDSNEEDFELNPEILEVLGEHPSTEKSFGEKLHKDIAPRWVHVLLNGLSKETRSEMLKCYLPPENCSNMKPPKLNLKIKAALTEIQNKKDMYSQGKQNQLACCLSALGKCLNVALLKKADIPQDIIKPLSDAGRLLCDYHHKESLSRRYAIINTLNKQTRDTIKNTKIDEYLFGSDLAEQLKSSKAISKSGMELRPVLEINPKARPPTARVPSVIRRGALNSRGAPRVAAAGPRANPLLPTPPRQPQSTRERFTSYRRPGQRQHSRRQ